MTTYKKLSDMLNGETPHGFARGVYKGVGCGPWISYIMKNGKDVYYEDKRANKKIPDKFCVGIKIGSIVEGSDVEIGPQTLHFPFTDKDLWDHIENINREASFYWERDNTETFTIMRLSKRLKTYVCIGTASWTAFNDKPKWDGKVPKAIKQKWTNWYSKDRFVNGSCVIPDDRTWDFVEGWKCIQIDDDSIF